MAPRSGRLITERAARVPCTTPRKSTSSTRSNVSLGTVSNAPMAAMPALLIQTSGEPKASRTRPAAEQLREQPARDERTVAVQAERRQQAGQAAQGHLVHAMADHGERVHRVAVVEALRGKIAVHFRPDLAGGKPRLEQLGDAPAEA